MAGDDKTQGIIIKSSQSHENVTHSFAGGGHVLLDERQSDGNESLLENSLPHCAAVIIILLQKEQKRI